MIIKHPMIKEEAAVTCLKYMISKYVLVVLRLQFCLGFKLRPSNIFTFLKVNFPLSKYIRELFWGWQRTLLLS